MTHLQDWLSDSSGLPFLLWKGRWDSSRRQGLRGWALASEKETEAQRVKQLASNHTVRNTGDALQIQLPDPKAHTFPPVKSRHPSSTGIRSLHCQA